MKITPKSKNRNEKINQARSRDPDGTLHGVLGQKKYGYFEASPNHDAIALRIVDDADAEKIMVQTDELGAKIRPNTFMIPNTDAGGGKRTVHARARACECTMLT